MRYQVLGTTQATRPDGTPVPVGGARLRALLTLLALRAGRAVPSAVLVDEVWAGEPPADATGALQALVGRLRRTLGADAVTSAEGGYRLAADPDDVDLHRFDRLAADGLRALDGGDPAKAAHALDEALALWRGPVLADLPDPGACAARWEARRLEVRRARLTAALALGEAAAALPDLTALCEAHPLDEPLQALRLRALAATGRPAEALAAYGDLRRHLADTLGTDPGPVLRAVYADLLRGDADPHGAGPHGAVTPPAPRSGARAAAAARPLAHQAVPSPPPGDAAGEGAPGGGGAESGGAAGPEETGGPVPGPGRAARSAAGSGPDAWAGAAGAEGGYAPGGTAGPHRVPGRGEPAGPGPVAGRPGGVPRDAAGPGEADSRGRAAGPDGAHVPGGTAHPAGTAGPDPAAAAGADADADDADAAARDGGSTGTDPAGGAARHGAAAPAHRSAPGNLRTPLTSFVGRDADVTALHSDLAGARLVTLLGPGGAGKTRLSQEAARTAAGLAPDGVWLAELAPVDDPAAVPEAVLTAVGGRETVLYGAGAEEIRAVSDRKDDPLRRLTEHCSRRRMLLVLDNCEHVVDAAARLAEELLARCPNLTVLATSREPLGVPGELVRPVDPLPQPHAMRLLADRGAAARPGFRVDTDPETAEACAEICRRLDGLPLAIELAAARLRMLTPRQMADRLDDRFRLLTSGSRTALPRQQTLRAVVDWSWDLLDDHERAVLRRLSVFAGGCDLEAAEAVCGPEALEALGSLVDKSLVVAASSGGGQMRYRLLETVAEYARERLLEAGEHGAAFRAHLAHYRELARRTDPLLRGHHQFDAVGRLETEYENLRTALRTAVTERDEQEGLCLVLSLAWFWQIRGLRGEARQWSSAVLELGPSPFTRDAPPAVPLWERCTDKPPPLTGDLLQEARRGVHLVHLACMDMQGELQAWQNPEAQEKLRSMAAAYEPGMPQVCRNPGNLWFFAVLLTGQVDRLREIVDAAVRTTAGRPDHAWEHALALHTRANLVANRPDWEGDAVADADRSLEICRRLGDVWSIAEGLCARAAANERRGRFEQAADDYRQAVEQVELLGAHAQREVLRARLGGVLLETGRPERGERLLREVIAAGPLGDQEAGPAARIVLASWLGVTGRIAEARGYLREIREEFPAAAFIVFDSFITGSEALLDAMDEGRSDEALDRVRRALVGAGDALARTIAPHIRTFLLTVASVALAAVDGGRRARDGARCLGAAVAAMGHDHLSGVAERRLRDHAEAVLRAALGDAAYEAAYAEGRGLPVEEAAALV